MTRAKFIAIAALTTLAGYAEQTRAATAFSDTFATSTLNSATPAPPTTAATNYAVLSAKNAQASAITSGSLKLQISPTNSGLAEVQALFSSSPLGLATDGDYVELRATFVPTGIVYVPSGNATFNAGLFNSHGTTPVTGGQMNNGQLGTTGTDFATGFAAGWEGYATRVQATSARVYTRPIQTDTTNESQDVLFSDSGTGAFDNPVGVTLSPNLATGVTFTTDGSPYTYTLRLTLNAGILDIAQNIYQGANTSGTNVLSHTTTSTASTPTTSFDSFAFGFRAINDATTTTPEHSLNFSLIEVTTNVALPNPANANFDGVGQVDGNDFLKWQQGLGLTGQTTNANGDANSSGVVDATDLGIWRSHFGQPTSVISAAAVPEPTGLALASVTVVGMMFVRRRR